MFFYSGADTRNTFTSYLRESLHRKGIDAFFDEILYRGQDLSDLFHRIEQSKMSIVVFSENYANSTWCLEELWKIMQCREKSGHGVIPIFYKVSKSDVENQKGSFEAPFKNPEESFKGDVQKVGAWKEALRAASNVLGFVPPGNRYVVEKSSSFSALVHFLTTLTPLKNFWIYQTVLFIMLKGILQL